MVMGKVTRHYVEIEPTKDGFTSVCSCGWRFKAKTKALVKSNSYVHLSVSYVGA
jgi:hypothetical protein